MRTIAIALTLLVACDEHGTKPPGDGAAPGNEGTVVVIDAPMGTVDAPKAIEQACAAACDKLATCANLPPTTECNALCAADISDCTPQQVMDVQNCSAVACNGTADPVSQCLRAIPCVDMP